MFDTVLNTPMMYLNIRKKCYHNIQKIFMVDHLFKRYTKLSENQDSYRLFVNLRIGTSVLELELELELILQTQLFPLP